MIYFFILLIFFQINFDDRRVDPNGDTPLSVDCTDCEVYQKGRVFSSHKFGKHSGVRYEIAIGIMTGEVKWINGPFPCGKYQDVTIFRESLVSFLDDFERVEADDGYEGESPFRCKIPKAVLTRPSEADALQKRVQGRHETINARLKALMLHNMGGSFVLLLFLHSSPSKMENHFSVLPITNVDFEYML